MSPARIDISRLGLHGNALLAAEAIAEEHPDVEFTDGLRSRDEQADRMAKNIVRGGRKWIENTYKSTAISRACQRWVDSCPGVVTAAGLAVGLLGVLRKFSDDALALLSKHFTGLAFDVKPGGSVLLAAIRRIVAKFGGTLIEDEGGVPMLHCQFPE